MKLKRIIMLVCVLCISCNYCMAGSKVILVQGNKKDLKSMEGKVLLEFIWDGAMYDNKMELEDKFTNLEELKPYAWSGFVEEFDDRCAACKVTKDQQSAKYKFSMKVDNMDQYFKVMCVVPSPATKVWGTLTITNIESNEVIAKIKVEAVNGGANPSPTGTFSDCFEELGKHISRFTNY